MAVHLVYTIRREFLLLAGVREDVFLMNTPAGLYYLHGYVIQDQHMWTLALVLPRGSQTRCALARVSLFSRSIQMPALKVVGAAGLSMTIS